MVTSLGTIIQTNGRLNGEHRSGWDTESVEGRASQGAAGRCEARQGNHRAGRTIRDERHTPEGAWSQRDDVRRGPQENREGSEVALGKAKAASRQEVGFEQDYLHI